MQVRAVKYASNNMQRTSMFIYSWLHMQMLGCLFNPEQVKTRLTAGIVCNGRKAATVSCMLQPDVGGHPSLRLPLQMT